MSFINRRGKTTAWRKQIIRRLASDVILKEKVETGVPMAKSLTKLISKLIGWAKRDDLHSRRLALRFLVNEKHTGVMKKLFTDLKDRYKERNGGYTRFIKKENRLGDSSLRVVFSLV